MSVSCHLGKKEKDVIPPFLWKKASYFALLASLMEKITSKIEFFSKKVWSILWKALSLQHENPPSLFTMLKSAGRFVFLWHVTPKPIHRLLSWRHYYSRAVSMLRMSYERKIISAILDTIYSARIFIHFLLCPRRIMCLSLVLHLIKLWPCIVLTDICAC